MTEEEKQKEFDFSNKWAEAIGQSLYYASQIGKKPGIFLICSKYACKKHFHNLQSTIDFYKLPIKVFKYRL